MAIDAPDLSEISQVCDFAEVRLEQISEGVTNGHEEPLSAWEGNCLPRVRAWLKQLVGLTQRDKIKLAAKAIDEANYGVETIWTLSTGHVTEETGKLLDQQANGKTLIEGLVVYPHRDYGWLIWVGSNYPDEIKDAPDELDNLLRHCSELGLGWMLLDRDAPENPDFTIFDW